MSAHTPGPWHVAEVWYGKIGVYRIANNRDATVGSWDASGASVESQGARSDANARLIAAAPSMLDALRTCILLWEHGESPEETERGGDPEAIRMARAAIRNATGGGDDGE